MRRHGAVGLAVLVAGLAAVCGHAAAAGAVDRVDIRELVRRCRRAYVFVGGGSGAIISPDGYVITNAHVTRNSKRWKLRTPDGEYHPARVVGLSPGTDLALLKIDHAENLPHLPLGDSDQVRIGDVVIAIGNPFALGNIDGKPTVTLGVVSALHVDRPHAYDAVQTDTPINPGNSGGPLISLKGELIGVNAQIQTRFGLRQNTGVGYAISSNQVKRFLPALKAAEGKAVRAGKIGGVQFERKADAPAVVSAVRAGSPAAEAGIKKGDEICGLDKAPVHNVRDLMGALGRYPIGAGVTVRVLRGDPPEKLALQTTIAGYGEPYIGLHFDPKQRRSLRIASVDPDSPAAKAGIKKGDVLFAIGRARLPNRQWYYRYRPRLQPHSRVPFVVRRGRRLTRVIVLVGERE